MNDQNIDLVLQKLGDQTWHPVGIFLNVTMDYFNILAFDITAFAQTLSEQFQAEAQPVGLRIATYAGSFRRLLRLGGKAKRKERGAECEAEDALAYS